MSLDRFVIRAPGTKPGPGEGKSAGLRWNIYLFDNYNFCNCAGHLQKTWAQWKNLVLFRWNVETCRLNVNNKGMWDEEWGKLKNSLFDKVMVKWTYSLIYS